MAEFGEMKSPPSRVAGRPPPSTPSIPVDAINPTSTPSIIH